MPNTYEHKCSHCSSPWESESITSLCPACGEMNEIPFQESEENLALQKAMEMDSPLSRDVAEAEAHLAVGIAGVSTIIAKLELQRRNLQDKAQEIIEKAKITTTNKNDLESFLMNAILMMLYDNKKGYITFYAPAFIDFSGHGFEPDDTWGNYKHYHIDDPPEWLVKEYKRQSKET